MKKIFLLLLFFLAACRPSPVNVALVLPENGSMDDLRNGIELAAQRINSEGGIYGHIVRVLPASADGKIDLKGASVVVMATGNGETVSSVEGSAEKMAVPLIIVNPVLAGGGSGYTAVSFSKNALDEAFFMGDFCAFSLHASKVLVLDGGGDLADSFEKGFGRERRETVRLKAGGTGPGALAEEVGKALSSKSPPQSVFWASGEEIPKEVSAKLGRELKGRTLLVTAACVLNSAGDFPNPALTSLPYFDGRKRAAGIVEFNVDYKARFGSRPSSWSAAGYETMTAIKQSFESGARTAEGMRAFLRDVEMNFVLLGKLNFNSDCELVIPFDMAMLNGRSAVPLREMDRNTLVGLQEKVLAFRYGQEYGKDTDKK